MEMAIKLAILLQWLLPPHVASFKHWINEPQMMSDLR